VSRKSKTARARLARRRRGLLKIGSYESSLPWNRRRPFALVGGDHDEEGEHQRDQQKAAEKSVGAPSRQDEEPPENDASEHPSTETPNRGPRAKCPLPEWPIVRHRTAEDLVIQVTQMLDEPHVPSMPPVSETGTSSARSKAQTGRRPVPLSGRRHALLHGLGRRRALPFQCSVRCNPRALRTAGRARAFRWRR